MTNRASPRRNWIDRLPAEPREAMRKAMVPRVLPRGTLLYSRQDAPEGLYLIRSGSAVLSLDGEHGGRLILAVLGPGDLFGEAVAFDGRPAPVAAETRTRMACELVPMARITALQAQYPEIAAALAKVAAVNLRAMVARLEEQVLMPLPQRVAARLAALARLIQLPAGEQGPVRLDLTQSELAAMVGASRQAVNGELARLEEKGAIRRVFRGIDVWRERLS